MASLNAYLEFNDQCQEAMTFYKSCLGGELILNTVGDSPMAAQMPTEMRGKILHSMLASGKIVLMGSDMGKEKEYKPKNSVSLCLVCDSQDEIERLFSLLSKGSRVIHPLKKEFFGTFGAITDKYGINWMFQFGGIQKT